MKEIDRRGPKCYKKTLPEFEISECIFTRNRSAASDGETAGGDWGADCWLRRCHFGVGGRPFGTNPDYVGRASLVKWVARRWANWVARNCSEDISAFLKMFCHSENEKYWSPETFAI